MADSYHEYVVTGVTAAQAKLAADTLASLDLTGVEVSLLEYTPGDSTLRISIGGSLGAVTTTIQVALAGQFGVGNVTDGSVAQAVARVQTGADAGG